MTSNLAGTCLLYLCAVFATLAEAASSNLGSSKHHRSLQQDEGPDTDYLIPYHGWFMTATFGVIFPAGVALPILFKGTRAWPVAFQAHRVVQVLGMAFLIAGLALGSKLEDDEGPQKIHKGIGIAVFALVWLQGLLALFARPATHGKARGIFNVLHWWGGRTAIVVGVGNAYYGMNITQPATRYFVGFSVAIGGWLLIAVVGQILLVLFNQYDHDGRALQFTSASDKVGHRTGTPLTGATTHASPSPA